MIVKFLKIGLNYSLYQRAMSNLLDIIVRYYEKGIGMEVNVTNKELGHFYGGQTEGAIRALKKREPKKYMAMLNAYIEAMEENQQSSEPFVITTLMFKGGVGKSNISRIINASLAQNRSVLLNIDISRDVKKYTDFEAINFVEVLNDEPDIDVAGYIDTLKQSAEYIVIDTPGEIGNAEMLSAISKTDLFIMPFGTDPEESDVLITTLTNTLLTDEGYYPKGREIDILFVLNNYQEAKELQDAKEVLSRVMDVIEQTDHLEVNIYFTHLKYSKAIKTMNRTKKSITQLSVENFVAYRVAKERSLQFMKDVKNTIQEIKERRYGE